MKTRALNFVRQKPCSCLRTVVKAAFRKKFVTALIVSSFTSLIGQNEVFCETARASFYSNKFEGRKCSNGMVFRQSGFTAAHCALKFGTRVKVTNLKNDSSVVVEITDRMPRKGKCAIDLTMAAAKQLNFVRAGLARVRIEILKDSLP